MFGTTFFAAGQRMATDKVSGRWAGLLLHLFDDLAFGAAGVGDNGVPVGRCQGLANLFGNESNRRADDDQLSFGDAVFQISAKVGDGA
ncbi:MAG: hypothetical protein R3C28_01500 [Pirellulaceae bacterium]